MDQRGERKGHTDHSYNELEDELFYNIRRKDELKKEVRTLEEKNKELQSIHWKNAMNQMDIGEGKS